MKRTQQTALSAKEREMTERALRFIGGDYAIDLTAAPSRGPRRNWGGKVKSQLERQAKAAERTRRQPYAVMCTCEGERIVYGYTDDPTGGMPLSMAKLTPWAKNPRVVGLLPG